MYVGTYNTHALTVPSIYTFGCIIANLVKINDTACLNHSYYYKSGNSLPI